MSENISRRNLLGLGAAVGGSALLGSALLGSTAQAADRSGDRWPDRFALPDGFQPEGIAIDSRGRAYFGSLADGAIHRVELATGRGTAFSAGPAAGTPSLGLKVDGRDRLFVAGGGGGDARVLDTRTGAVLASYRFVTGEDTFVNDVVLTPEAAWFTDSARPVLHVLPLGPGGRLPRPDQVGHLPLTGEFDQEPGSFGANGIETTPDGRALLVVNMTTGSLHRVDPRSGVARKADLGGESLTRGDGLLRQGRELFAVRNLFNEIAVLRLDPAGRSGRVTRRITDPRFRIPTTVAAHGNRLYLPNARFDTEPLPGTDYDAIAVPRG
ncbi:SMP-30/gluconolactonase/LRE family protein [Kitasatospora sp. NPDC101801]|uniref:SMP-30/gluconolactonase/LRE family protein n=1 Tax=Kitasatospora sp. NPDC101801 TaxID=3364103 RepID=UPI00381BE45A